MLRKSCVETKLEFPVGASLAEDGGNSKENSIEEVNPGDCLEVDFDLELPLAVEIGVRYVTSLKILWLDAISDCDVVDIFTLHEGSFISSYPFPYHLWFYRLTLGF